jgi:hypothetical protein
MWPHLGWFTGCMCTGSLLGAVTWVARMQAISCWFEANTLSDTAHQTYTLVATSSRWLAVFTLSYGLEFLCFILLKLMLLGRLTDNVQRCLQARAPEMSRIVLERCLGRSLLMLFKWMAPAVLVCSLLGMVAFAASGAYNVQQAGIFDQAAAACDVQGRDTNSSLALFNDALTCFTKAFKAASVQNSSEAVTLLLISLGYAVAVPLSVSIFRQAELVAANALLSAAARTEFSGSSSASFNTRTERAVTVVEDTIHAAAEQRQRLVVACAIVLITFPARAAYDFILAYAVFNVSFNPACGICDTCQSTQYLILQWLNYTPEFQPIVVALSSPLPLTLSLWLITAAHARAVEVSLNLLRVRLGKDVFKR